MLKHRAASSTAGTDESSEGASDVGQYVGAVFQAVSAPFGSTVFFSFRVFTLVLLMPDFVQVRRYGRRPPPHARRSHTHRHTQTNNHTHTHPPAIHTRSRHVFLTGSGVYPPPFFLIFILFFISSHTSALSSAPAAPAARVVVVAERGARRSGGMPRGCGGV